MRLVYKLLWTIVFMGLIGVFGPIFGVTIKGTGGGMEGFGLGLVALVVGGGLIFILNNRE